MSTNRCQKKTLWLCQLHLMIKVSDFETKQGTNRVQGNKKGVFNRARQPKMVVRSLRDRWKAIPDFNYKK